MPSRASWAFPGLANAPTGRRWLRASDFGFLSSFVIRHSDLRRRLFHRNPRFITVHSQMRVASRLAATVVLLALLVPLRWSSMLLAAPQPVVDRKALPKFPPVAARDALNTFQLRKGFRLELVAAEPLVTDPIALAFDEDGRLFVVEMNDYPERGEQLLGQVRRLEDTDGDGRFDKSTVFAKGLRWPAAIFCYGGGVFVGSTPDLLFFKDTNDDGVADEKQVVLTGWGNRAARLEPEGAFGSLAWGLDNRIHGL